MTIVMGASPEGVKFVMICGLPSSKMRKFSFFRSRRKFPSLSVTTASTFTRLVLTLICALLDCGCCPCCGGGGACCCCWLCVAARACKSVMGTARMATETPNTMASTMARRMTPPSSTALPLNLDAPTNRLVVQSRPVYFHATPAFRVVRAPHLPCYHDSLVNEQVFNQGGS